MGNISIFTYTLATLGAITISTLIIRLARLIHTYTRPSSLPKYLHSSPNGSPPWALVTGASDGIGRGYAHELARHGFNIILHGRSPAKLSLVRSSILSSYPKTQIRLLILDTISCTPADIECRVKELHGLHITVPVNNVGTGTTPSGHVFANFEDEDPRDIDAIVNTNARFPAMFTHFVLPILSEPALILTMGSISDSGSPYISVYCGTKAFDTSFSKALRREMMAGQREIEVLVLMTAMVKTGKVEGTGTLVCPDARDYARSALQRVGCGREAVWGYWVHALVSGFLGLVGEGIAGKMMIESVKEAMLVEGMRK